MKTRTLIWIAGIAALVATVVWTTGVFAQGGVQRYGRADERPMNGAMVGPRAGMDGTGFGPRQGRGPGRGAGQAENSLVAVAADKLSMTEAELIAALREGKTIAQVAQERKVDPQTIVDAFVAQRAERLNAQVTAGRLTREQADQKLATIRARVTAQLDQPHPAEQGAGFVDANGDGVCDRAAAGQGTLRGGGPANRQGGR